MSRAAAGDMEAFGGLVERHHNRALNLAYRFSGDPEMARDIAQESFLRILKSAPRYVARGRFTTFLFTVVRNLFLELNRREYRRRETPLDEEQNANAGTVMSGIDPPDVDVEALEARQMIWSGLQSLPETLRAAFVLSEIEGLSYAEIADICQCPEGTVASRKHEALLRLRKRLGRSMGR